VEAETSPIMVRGGDHPTKAEAVAPRVEVEQTSSWGEGSRHGGDPRLEIGLIWAND
jgi:hypothetical protein